MNLTLLGIYWFVVGMLIAVLDLIGRVLTVLLRPLWAWLAQAHAGATIENRHPDVTLMIVSHDARSLAYCEVDLEDTATGDLWFARVYRRGWRVQVVAERYDEQEQQAEQHWLQAIVDKEYAHG